MKVLFTPSFLDVAESNIHVFRGIPTLITPHTKKELLSLFNRGGNRGNLFHFEAPQIELQYICKNSICSSITNLSTAEINSTFDAVVVSLANIIRINYDVTALYNTLKDIKIPIFALGIGLARPVHIGELNESVKNLLTLFQKKAELFAVRGKESELWCHNNGFSRAIALGCPSFYTFPNKFISSLSLLGKPVEFENIATAGHYFLKDNVMNSRGRHFLKKLSDLKKLDIVFQDEIFDYCDSKDEENIYDPLTGKLERRFFDPHFHRYGFDTSSLNYYYFNNTMLWRHFMSHHTCFCGDRLHGGIAAMQIGTPAYIFAEDIRVKELMTLLQLPILSIKECNCDIKEYLKSKFSKFDLNKVIDNYHGLLEKYKINFSNKFNTTDDFAVNIQMQQKNNTEYNRYPHLFEFVKDAKDKNILSFGCSTGEECFSLCTEYVHSCQVVGYDIDKNNIERASIKNRSFSSSNDLLFTSNLQVNKFKSYFDYIFALSVLCLWPETKNKRDISTIFPFDNIQIILKELDSMLKVGGFFIIYNSNYSFENSEVYHKYKAINPGTDIGFVKRFCNNGKEDNTNTKFATIFQKII